MSQLEKLIKQIFNGSQVSYPEAEKLLFYLGYSLRVKRSHHGFRKQGFKNIILKRRAILSAYQIRDLQEALINHGYN